VKGIATGFTLLIEFSLFDFESESQGLANQKFRSMKLHGFNEILSIVLIGAPTRIQKLLCIFISRNE
jgi:hypothetical protein